MPYTKQNFTDGQILQASHLNNIEQGIVNIENTIPAPIDFGETAGTAYEGNKGKQNADAIKGIQNQIGAYTLGKSVPSDAKFTDTTYTSLKNPYALTINGVAYDGSKAVSLVVSDDESIPSYVASEAERIITKILKAQSNRTFTFAAASDIHYGQSNYVDGIHHMCQAIKYIDERIKLDSIILLGDYTDGYVTTGFTNAIDDFKTVNTLLDKLRFEPNLRLSGNHDYYPDSAPASIRLIQAYNNDVVWGSRVGGYCYRDCDDYKIRLICLNTNENNTIAGSGSPNSGVFMTNDQIAWFAQTLDLSDKNDVQDWGILILSHQPIDFWVDTNDYYLSRIVQAYQKGESFSKGTIAYDFTNRNSAKIIGNIHGHLHNTLTDYIKLNVDGNGNMGTWTENIKTFRTCVPNACYSRENGYSGWQESITHSKTKDSATDTSFMVYCIDLDNFTVQGFCYGAGVDKSFIYDYNKNLTTYTITNNLTNVTTNNPLTSILEGTTYAAKLTFEGLTTQNITITMSDKDITENVYANGYISIPLVSGNITITASSSGDGPVEPDTPVTPDPPVEPTNLFDESAALLNRRMSSDTSGKLKDIVAHGYITTNFMDISDYEAKDVYKTSGLRFTKSTASDQVTVISFYSEADENTTLGAGATAYTNNTCADIEVDKNDNLIITMKYMDSNLTKPKYLRLSGLYLDENNPYENVGVFKVSST